MTRAARRIPSVLGPLGLLAALGLSGLIAPAAGVDAALLDSANSAQSLTASNWSVVVNASPGAKTFTPGAGSSSFTVNNNGNVTLGAVTVTVTNNYTQSVRVCPAGGACNSGGTTVTAGSTTAITHTPAQEPRAAGSATTWAFRRTRGGSGTITMSSAVSSASITPAPGTTNN
jgi:hypothetical protein